LFFHNLIVVCNDFMFANINKLFRFQRKDNFLIILAFAVVLKFDTGIKRKNCKIPFSKM
jgi:hypothetical protein